MMSQLNLFHRLSLFTILGAVLGVTLASPLLARQSLDHDVYTIWNRIEEQAISRDGHWAFWQMAPEQADGVLVVRATELDPMFTIERGSDAVFSYDNRHVVFLVKPTFEDARQARLDKASDEEKPKAGLGILTLGNGQQQRFERVRSFALPEESGQWVAFQHGVEPEDDEDEANGVEDEEEESEDQNGRDDDQKPGTTLVVLSLESGERHEIHQVDEYAWSANGKYLAFTRVSELGDEDGVGLFMPVSGDQIMVKEAKGHYLDLVFDSDGRQLAFLGRAHNKDAPDHKYSLYHWSDGDDQARVLADESAEFLTDGWHVSQHRSPFFSDNGKRLFFGTAPAPVEIPDNDDLLDDEVVKVDIWHWQDAYLQPMQLERLKDERKRSYLAVAHLDDGFRLAQLGRESIPEVKTANGGDARHALGLSSLPYRTEISWDFPRYQDGWLINVETGDARLIVEKVQAELRLSPRGTYIDWWDRDQATWMALRVTDGAVVDLGQGIEFSLQDHTNDRPFAAGPYATGDWLADDGGLFIHDRHDLWLVDPAAADTPVNLSQGVGRANGLNVRLVDLDPDDEGIDPDLPLLATVFDEANKNHGFYSLFLDGQSPVELVVSAHHYGRPVKADQADRLLWTRENFREFPDLWVSDPAFADMRRLSDANPQQADYRWGDVTLVDWESETGRQHHGMLFKPDDFDPARAYPMIVYFYERDSDRLHWHRPPQAHRSVIMPSFYTSNEYVVFVPDVWYREGYPGDSAMESIMPKVYKLADEAWVDAERIGIQGHSWAGYQIAYMVTQTDFFRAAAGGAPVANMTSAYGGIRWGTGMSRMFQYERTQSRLGKTLWEDPELYFHNSPLFMADQVNTPLLMMHNDQDGAVPWEQGIEMFVALRRLGRPAWLINYNDEPHWPTTFANRRDWQIRLQQFFDHYLKDEPAPRWLREGIPALEKGATLGFD